MTCGTPVAAYARGGLPEIVDDDSGRLAVPGDVEDLARALTEAARLDRVAVRASALRRLSLARMVDEYVALYRRMSAPAEAA